MVAEGLGRWILAPEVFFKNGPGSLLAIDPGVRKTLDETPRSVFLRLCNPTNFFHAAQPNPADNGMGVEISDENFFHEGGGCRPRPMWSGRLESSPGRFEAFIFLEHDIPPDSF